jgi:hypothetical protein
MPEIQDLIELHKKWTLNFHTYQQDLQNPGNLV